MEFTEAEMQFISWLRFEQFRELEDRSATRMVRRHSENPLSSLPAEFLIQAAGLHETEVAEPPGREPVWPWETPYRFHQRHHAARRHVKWHEANKDGPVEHEVDQLRRQLLHPEAELRQQAAAGIGGWQPCLLHLIPDLVETLDDENPEVARAAGEALTAIGEPGIHAMVARVEQLRGWAIKLLGVLERTEWAPPANPGE